MNSVSAPVSHPVRTELVTAQGNHTEANSSPSKAAPTHCQPHLFVIEKAESAASKAEPGRPARPAPPAAQGGGYINGYRDTNLSAV